jgi:MscS family membrane protein
MKLISALGALTLLSVLAATAQEPIDPLGRSTPHGAVVEFLTACQNEDFPRAAEYLETRLKDDAANELAQQLYVVLNRRLPPVLDKLSNQPAGSPSNALPPDKELVGVVPATSGSLTVLLDRVERNGRHIWLFAPETLKRVPEVYAEVESESMKPYLPAVLVDQTWLAISLWKWVGLLIGVALSLAITRLLRRLFLRMLAVGMQSLLQRTAHQSAIETLWAPLSVLIFLGLIHIVLASLGLPLLERQLWANLAGKATILAGGWLALRFIRISADMITRRMETSGRADTTAVLRLGQRTVNVLAVFVVFVLLLRSAGYDVTAMLAGLGVGGIAIAFAAQKTLENLFGGVSVIFDKPIRVGDVCSVANRVGTVEDIGLRSTRLRTVERTLLTIPNGQLSQMNLDNLSLRDKIPFLHTVSLRPETTPEQLRRVLEEWRKLLAGGTLVDASSAHVRLVKLSKTSLDCELFANVATTDFDKFLEIQESLLLSLFDAAVDCGSGLASNSTIVNVSRDSNLDAAPNSRPAQLSATGAIANRDADILASQPAKR